MQNLSINKRVFIGFVLATLVLASISGFVNRTLVEYQEQNRQLAETQEFMLALEKIVSGLKDVQAAQRGYVIVGEENYLVPYDIALSEIKGHFDTLKSKDNVSGNVSQYIKSLEELSGKRIAHADDIINTYRTKGQQAAFAMVKTGTGKREMDDIRRIAELIERDIFAKISERQIETDKLGRVTVYSSMIGLLLTTLVLLIVFLMVRREGLKREQSEKDLQDNMRYTNEIAQETQNISRLGDFLQNCKDADEACAIIAAQMPFLFPATSGGINMFNNSRNVLMPAVRWGEAISENDFVVDECWALRTGRLHNSKKDGTEPACRHLNGAVTGDALCMPLQAHGELNGVLFIRPEGDEVWTERKINFFRAVSEQISSSLASLRLRSTLSMQSVMDPLTGLYNRRYMEETFEREISRARRQKKPLSVLVLDIDHFKKFNDTYGHDGGDALLMAFAKMLRKNTRQEDVACRMGGEEFVIVLPDADAASAMARAEFICAATQDMQVILGDKTIVSVTVSIGVAALSVDGDEKGEDLINKADKALYGAKNAGRNQAKMA